MRLSTRIHRRPRDVAAAYEAYLERLHDEYYEMDAPPYDEDEDDDYDEPESTPMALTIDTDLIQGTQEWLQARAGIVTASDLQTLVTPKTMKLSTAKTVTEYCHRLAAERISQYVEPGFKSAAMQRGIDDEPVARAIYAGHYDVDVTEVGFMTRDITNNVKLGYSPDGLVGDNGLIEIKSRSTDRQIETIIADEPMPENVGQLQAALYVSGRDWIDYVSYCAEMPTQSRLWVIRVEPDPVWQEIIPEAVQHAETLINQRIQAYLEALKPPF